MVSIREDYISVVYGSDKLLLLPFTNVSLKVNGLYPKKAQCDRPKLCDYKYILLIYIHIHHRPRPPRNTSQVPEMARLLHMQETGPFAVARRLQMQKRGQNESGRS